MLQGTNTRKEGRKAVLRTVNIVWLEINLDMKLKKVCNYWPDENGNYLQEQGKQRASVILRWSLLSI